MSEPDELKKQAALDAFLKKNSLTASKEIQVNKLADGVEIILTLVGLGGVAKPIKFIFSHYDKIAKVASILKNFYSTVGSKDSFNLADIFGNKLVSAGDTLIALTKEGTSRLKVLTTNTFG